MLCSLISFCQQSRVGLLGLSWFYASMSVADVGQDTVSSLAQQEDRLADIDAESGHSVAPVLGYEPTFGFVFGAAPYYGEGGETLPSGFSR